MKISEFKKFFRAGGSAGNISAVCLPAILIAAVSFAQKLYVSFQSKYADGWDSYFYLIQVKSLVETSKMHSPDISPVYGFILIIFHFVGDYISAYKIAVSLLAAMFSLSLYFLSSELVSMSDQKNKKDTMIFIPYVVLGFSVFSPSLVFIAAQFPKNIMGFLFMNCFMAVFVGLLRNSSNETPSLRAATVIRGVVCVAFAVAAFITHRFSAGLICIVLVTAAGIHFIKYGIKLLVFIFPLLAAALLVSLVFPGTFHFSDLSRFSNLLQPSMQLVPLSFMNLLGVGKFSFIWKAELFTAYAGFFVCSAVFIFFILKRFFLKSVITEHGFFSKGKIRIMFIIVTVFFLLVFPFYVIDTMGIGYRFYTAFLVYYPLLLFFIPDKIGSFKYALIFPVIMVSVSFFSVISFSFTQFNPPYEYYEKLTLKSEEILHGKERELVVAHKAFAEIYTFTSGFDALPWKPEERFDRKKVWRISHGADCGDIVSRTSLPAGEYVYPLDGSYCIVREDVWQEYLSLLEYDRPAEFLELRNWMNPYEVRPAFITKKRKYEK